MNLLEKYSPYLILVAGILVVVFTFINSRSDQRQKDRIQQLTENDGVVTLQVKEIVDSIRNTSSENQKLAVQTKSLITQVDSLTKEINSLTAKINVRAAYDEAETRQTDRLEFPFNPRLSKQARLFLGSVYHPIPFEGLNLRNDDATGGNIFMNVIYLKDELVISLKVLDTSGNLIAEIDKNRWRANPNFTGKRNYDNFGFEVIDNQGNIVLNVDQIGNDVHIHGILALSNGSVLVASNDGVTVYLPDDFKKGSRKLNIRQLFEYTGNDYIGKRRK